MVGHVTSPPAQPLSQLPSWVSLVRAPNPGPMTLDGTNTWVLRAPGAPAIVIDPGPRAEEHLAAVARHAPVAAILTTHSHPDHVEGLPRLHELLPAAIVGQRGTPEVDGLVVSTVVTPGHTADSVCFVVTCGGESVVCSGDTILGRGTTVVAYPDGNLGDYLTSLEALARLGPLPVLPGHGPALADCGAAARFYVEHRLARLEQVRGALRRGARTAEEIVASSYADVDRALWPAATKSVRAQLAYLRAQRESPPPPPELDRP